MNKYVLIEYVADGIGDGPRIVGRVMRNNPDPSYTGSLGLVREDWRPGYPIDAVDIKDAISQLRFAFNPDGYLFDGGEFEPTGEHNVVSLQPQPAPAQTLKFVEIGDVTYNDSKRRLVAIVNSKCVSINGTAHHAAKGYYREDTAIRFATGSDKELIEMVFAHFRKS